MIKKHLWVAIICACCSQLKVHAQDMAIIESEYPLHLKELVTSQREAIFSGIDSLKRLSYSDPLHSAEDSLVFNRMRKIQKTVPLAFNEQIKFFIDKYVSANYHPYMCKLQGLAQYYFPIYEEILRASNLPDEIKYLSVVESSLDPHLVSRSGAVGPWQFMYGTAKIYDLAMNGDIDERKDPYAACFAAGRYFQEAFEEFDDWLLALASYNCGRGAVRRAIQRSGIDHPDFWQLSPFLPQETRNYIPKFIAMTYVLKHSNEYGIEAASTDFALKAKPVMVENNVNLNAVAEAINLPLETLKKFNPSLKRTVVVASVERPRRLILPETVQLNDSLLYIALNTGGNVPVDKLRQFESQENTASSLAYRVKKGETLTSLSRKFGVSVQDLKAWNGLSAQSQIAGRTLLVKKEESTLLAKVSSTEKKKTITYVTYTVRKGDTLSHIAERFKGSTVSAIRADNNLKGSALKIGQKLRIKKS
ncbi:LysM peptidoglycan-binding domain-containing protein [Sphingobacterium sp. LRF_L2]|uniref:lytic transglycosylase n=1 Tax=Sphingobacterium sp. LRF_L2 TaxID=3369421 RepID=UPI003F60CD25